MHPVEMIRHPLGWALRNRRPNEGASITRAPELASETRFTLTSPSLADGTVIPAKHCGRFIGAEISPALTWNALPTGTKGLVLVIEDLDSPSSSPGIHTIAAFAPHGGGLPEGALPPADAEHPVPPQPPWPSRLPRPAATPWPRFASLPVHSLRHRS